MTLCGQCSAISIESLLSKQGYVLHPDLPSLYRSAQTCESCYLLLSHLRHETQKRRTAVTTGQESHQYLVAVESLERALHGAIESTNDDPLPMPVTLTYSQDYAFRVRKGPLPPPLRQKPSEFTSMNVFCGGHQYGGFYISTSVHVYVYPGDDLQFLGLHVRDRLAPSSIDPLVIAKVKNWMEHCATTHPECQNADHGPDPNPRRLLDIRDAQGAQIFRILDVPAGFKDQYVALSYCWGKTPGGWIEYIRKVQDSPTKMIEGRLMPKTIQDAITSCLALGYMYLWVDCLCIIQHDHSNWLQESIRMDKIYANAALVISASATTNCEDGFLRQRSELQQEGVVLPLELEKDDGQKTVSNLHLCSVESNYAWVASYGPVFGRAWCLQERQLASRVLHICQDNVTFECTRARRFESEVLPMDEFDIYSEHYRTHIPFDKHLCNNPKPSAGAQSILMWCATVEDYSLRHLSMTSDKLIAISGLAKRAHMDIGGLYLAGVWQQQLHIGLAWQTVGQVSPATRASTYRAPSWSWASIDGPVDWQLIDGYVQSDDGFIVSAISFVDHTIHFVGTDAFGPIRYAEIVLVGSLLSIPVTVLLQNKLLTYPEWMSGKFPDIVGWYMEDERKTIEVDEIVCLKLGTRPFGPGPSLPPTNEMLILERVASRTSNRGENTTDDGVQVYRRIGFGQILVTNYFDKAPVVELVLV